MPVCLAVENLRLEIPLPAGMLHPVRGVSFSVARGETLCLVGESGCGKSLTALALMNLLPGAARRQADVLSFGGLDLRTLGERAMADLRGDKLAMIFQEPMTSLNPAYTVGEQLQEVLLRHKRVSRPEARARAVHLLNRVGITAAESRLRQYPHQLSGGLRQRVMIAMALMCGPDLIVADEPTTALDVTIQAQILRLLADLQREFHMAMLLITHDLGVVARVADRVAVMYAGQIVETGTAEELFSRPLHPYTQGLLRCIPGVGGIRPGQHLGSIPGLVPNLIGGLRGCTFRDRCPHAFAACADGDVSLRALAPGRAYRCLLTAEPSTRNAAAAEVA
jgi:peptide/nickel transport system ATP-binding protein